MVQLILSVMGKERTRRRTVRKEQCMHAVSPVNPHPHRADFNLKLQMQLKVLRLGLGLDLQEL